MEPDKLVEDEKPVKKPQEVLDEQLSLYNVAKQYRTSILEPKAARALKVLKGIPIEDSNTRSKVTGRPKIYFRKVWSTAWRLLSSFYQAYLQDKNKFKIHGRDDQEDFLKAKVLEFVVRYRLDRLMRRNSAFKKLLWSFMDAICPGVSVIKLYWKYNEEYGYDEPDFVVYPLEQVVLDWEQPSLEEARFVMFENYLSMDELEGLGYKNLKELKAVPVPQSVLRAIRYSNTQDPSKVMSESQPTTYTNGAAGNNYPSAENTPSVEIHPVLNKYLVVEAFYRKGGKIYFCAFDPASKTFLKDPAVSPYGSIFPVVVGSMLIEPHKLLPESLAEVLEGPQESLNFNLNVRKDATLLAMAPGFIYGRFANVDKQALSKIFPGFTVAADDPSQVSPIKMADVGQNAYTEAAQDSAIIEEEGGVNQQSLGNSNTGKTGEAQINLAQSSAKLDLYTAIMGQTLFHQFIYILAFMCQLFETDEKVFKLANAKLRQDKILPEKHDDVYDLEFDMDLDIDVGVSEASRIVQSQRLASVVDRMLQMNNSTFLMMKSGIKIENPQIYDVAKMGADLFPEMGVPNTSQYLVSVTPPPPPPQPGAPAQTGGAQAQVAEGQNAPQPNEAAGPQQDDFMQNLMSSMGGQQ